MPTTTRGLGLLSANVLHVDRDSAFVETTDAVVGSPVPIASYMGVALKANRTIPQPHDSAASQP